MRLVCQYLDWTNQNCKAQPVCKTNNVSKTTNKNSYKLYFPVYIMEKKGKLVAGDKKNTAGGSWSAGFAKTSKGF